MSHGGVSMCAWVKIEGDCRMEYILSGDTVEILLGGYIDGFQFDATELGLERLIETCTVALHAFRSGGSPVIGT
jgi:hypothetical protein